jgi:hypothetical protein
MAETGTSHWSIVRDLAARTVPLLENQDGSGTCALCDADDEPPVYLEDPAAHRRTCPWRRAREAVRR